MLRRPRLVSAAAAVVGVLALAACSSPQPGQGQPAAAVVSAHAQDPVDLIAQARSGLDEVLAYEVTGWLLVSGTRVDVDLAVDIAGGHGTLTRKGVKAVLDYVAFHPVDGSSGLYITAPAAFWTNAGESAADAARYAGQQVSVPETSEYASGVQLLDQKGLTQYLFLTAGKVEKPSVLATPPVDGQPAWVVDYGPGRKTRLTMMQNAQQFPLRLVSPRAQLTFGHFGKEPVVDSPDGTAISLPG